MPKPQRTVLASALWPPVKTKINPTDTYLNSCLYSSWFLMTKVCAV